MSLLGPLAALGASLCWSFTSTIFTLAGRRVGSMVVNRTRLVFAVLFLMLTHWLVQGTPFPWHVAPERWFWLSLSSILALVIGDALLFQSFIWLGPRLTMLIMSATPILSALLAWLFLHERLSAIQWLAIAIIVMGISAVVLDKNGSNAVIASGRKYRLGILFGLGSSLGQAAGLITAKKGLAGDFSVLSGTLIRMFVGMSVLWGLTLATGKGKETLRTLKDNSKAFWQLLTGSFLGPFLAVYLSLMAIQTTEIGIASTLMSMTPVLLLPISHFVFGERIHTRAVLGTMVAVAGVVMLVW